jgi:transcriptional regulator with XRE-family HTH domain
MRLLYLSMKPKDKKRLQRFRENLAQIRKEKGLSQRGLSYLCDVDHTKISKLESDEDTNLNLTTLFELARGLAVHPKELIDYDMDFMARKK